MITRLSKQSDVLEALEKLIGHCVTVKVLCSLNFSALIRFKEVLDLFSVFPVKRFCFIFCNVG